MIVPVSKEDGLVDRSYGQFLLVAALIYRARFSWRETLAGGILLSSRLSLIIAPSTIGREMCAVSEAVNAAIILVPVVTCTLSPILFNRLFSKAGPRDRVIIVGARPVACLLARSLREHHVKVALVGDRGAVLESARRLAQEKAPQRDGSR